MVGGPPFTVHSPTQSSRFVPYSPTSKHNNYNYEQHQPPPQTPPSFAPATLAQSPRFGHSAPESSPPSAMNGNGHHRPDPAPHYHIHSTSPHQQHSRNTSGPPTGSKGHPSYSNIPSSHAHPSSRQGSLAFSPKQEYTSAMNNQRLDVAKFEDTPSVAQSSRPSSHEVMKAENPLLITCTYASQAEAHTGKRSNVVREHPL
jgi:chromatin-remodeling ATPase INO80